jgi:hypothetical protein
MKDKYWKENKDGNHMLNMIGESETKLFFKRAIKSLDNFILASEDESYSPSNEFLKNTGYREGSELSPLTKLY